MEEAMNKGADFLQMAWTEHMKQKKQAKESKAKYPGNKIEIILPTVLVHCVAGMYLFVFSCVLLIGVFPPCRG